MHLCFPRVENKVICICNTELETMIVEIFQMLFGGVCVGLASSVTVGPVAVLCIQRTLSKGYLSGFMSGLGVACADTILAILSFTVYALLKHSIDQYNTTIQICGGIFVIIVGVFIFFKNPVPQIRKNRAGKTRLWQDFASMFGFTLANFVVIIPYILAFFTMFSIDLSNGGQVLSGVADKQELVMDGAGTDLVADTAVSIEKLAVADMESVEGAVDEADDSSEGLIAGVKTKGSRAMNTSLVLLGFLLGATLWWVVVTSLINLFRKRFRPRHMLTINHVAGVVIGVLGLYTLLSVIIK